MQNTQDLKPIHYRIRVAVPVHLYDCFDYLVTEDQYQQIEAGSRVSISFGRQNLIGIVVEKLPPDAPLNPSFKLKLITEILDHQPILDEKVLSLLTWSAQYYQFPIGEVMQSALPTLLRQGKPANILHRVWTLVDHQAEDKIKRSVKQQDAYKILKLHPQGTSENILNLAGIESTTLKALERKNICQCTLETQDLTVMPVSLAQMPLTANEEQKKPLSVFYKPNGNTMPFYWMV